MGTNRTTELHLLGGFGASVDGRPIEALRTAAATRLLAYLALHRGTRPRRMYLASLFWPDGSEARARRRLSHTLWELQSALAPIDATLVQADRDTIGLSPDADLWIDADMFERQIDNFELIRRDGNAQIHADTLARTIGLYRGDLLSDHYDEWIEPLRFRLREKFLLGIRHLVQLQKASGDHSAALLSARRLVSETPLAEQAHMELMRLYWLAGRPDEAIAQHDVCTRILADELGVEPSDEMRDLKNLIVAQRRRSQPPVERDPSVDLVEDESLVGRAAERSQLLAVVDAAFGGSGGFALVEGQAGMGKTRLLADVADAARWRGAAVLWSRRTRRISEPYGPVTAALGQVLRGLRREQVVARLDSEFLPLAARLIPGLGESDALPVEAAWTSPDERWQYQEALSQVLLTLGSIEPVTLILDDLDQIDTETLEFLRLVAPRMAQSQVAAILAFRSQEARNRPELWDLITNLEQHQRVERMTLGGLTRPEVAELVRTRSGQPGPAGLVEQLERSTGGNPLFIVETMRAIERSAAHDGAGAGIAGHGVSTDPRLAEKATVERVIEVLTREIEAAPGNLQLLVGALAIWNEPATSTALMRLLDLDIEETLSAIRAGVDAEFISESDEGYHLRFEQLAEAARNRLPDHERRALHLRAASLLVEDPLAPAAALATHYAEAERWVEASRFEAAAAARAASIHSYEAAADYYNRSLRSHDLAGHEPSIGLLLGQELVLDTLGHRDEQAQVLERLDAHLDTTAANRVRVLHRRAAFEANTDQAVDAVRTATTAVGLAVASRIDPIPGLVTLAKVLIMAGLPDLARRHLESLMGEGAPAAGQAHAHLALGLALADMQDFDGARVQLREALAVFRVHKDTRGQIEALAAVAVVHCHRGDSAAALQDYDEAITLARQIGSRFGEGMALANLGLLHYMEGNGAASLTCLEESIEVLTSIGHRRGEATVRVNRAAILHSVIGDDALAEKEASFARRYFTEVGDERHEAQCLDVLAGLRRRKRNYAVARRLLETAIAAVRPSNDHWLEVQMLRSLAWTEYDADRHPEAQEALERAIALCEAYDLDLELPALLALDARNRLAQGDHAAAQAAAERSLELQSDGAGMRHTSAWWRSTVFDQLGLAEAAEADLQTAHRCLIELLEPFDDATRDAARSRIAENRELTLAYARRFPRTETALLVPEYDPSLEPCIEVHWTVHHPDDLFIQNKKERRHHRLIRILDEASREGARPRLEDLATALDTSLSTLKRDLSSLRSEGLLN